MKLDLVTYITLNGYYKIKGMEVHLGLFNNQRMLISSMPPRCERGKHIMALEPEIIKIFQQIYTW
jgi:hypothetical protein